ncbi:hypothetical protein E3N88_36191 [Mikania micrantha]|uniref:Uncharacterized protein n=1 Tax=Mikania micrantha TaxID=192012 RepID=A0A5N6M3L1_9ASTR|nr:hypothetical protein E3N88_36191 [Mikania micrantha]
MINQPQIAGNTLLKKAAVASVCMSVVAFLTITTCAILSGYKLSKRIMCVYDSLTSVANQKEDDQQGFQCLRSDPPYHHLLLAPPPAPAKTSPTTHPNTPTEKTIATNNTRTPPMTEKKTNRKTIPNPPMRRRRTQSGYRTETELMTLMGEVLVTMLLMKKKAVMKELHTLKRIPAAKKDREGEMSQKSDVNALITM